MITTPPQHSLTVLVIAAVGDAPGYVDKYRGWADGFRDAGCDVTLLTAVTPEMLLAISSHPFDVTMVRNDPGALPLAGYLRHQQARGTRVVAEIPTPLSVAMHEVRRMSLPVRERLGIARAFAETTRIWRKADLIVQTAPEGFPWRLGSRRRLTLTNGAPRTEVVHRAWARRDTLRFLFAAHPNHWNGIERLVRGMPGCPNAELLLAGPPDRFAGVLALAESLGLGHRVRTLGLLDTRALNAAMEDVDVGVSSLALSRIGRIGFSPLKTRAYLSAGLPVLYADLDPDLVGCPFALRAPSGAEDIDVVDVARWLGGLRARPSPADEIAAFAAAAFSYGERADRVLAALG